MNSGRLIVRSLRHYWPTHLAVLLGVAAGTAVISGALIVGDSVRDSLRQMTLDRLGRIDHALHATRFVREELARELTDRTGSGLTVAPLLIMQGAIVREAADGTVLDRVGGVTVYGIDERFAALSEFTRDTLPAGDGVVLSHRVATQLGASPGDGVTLWVELPSMIPRESLLGGIADQETQDVPLTVRDVLPETSGVGRFALSPSQQLPPVAFVSLSTLQDAVDLSTVRRSRELPSGRPARVNAFVAGPSSAVEVVAASGTGASQTGAVEAARSLSAELGRTLTLDDLHLRVVAPEGAGYLSLESERMILEDAFAQAGRSAARELGWPVSEALVYLVNELSNAADPAAFSMYSIVAGIDFDQVARPPFGPAFPDRNPDSGSPGGGPAPPRDGQIVLNDWLAADLNVEPGATVRLTYHTVGSHGDLPEEVVEFRVHSVLPLAESVTARDRGLTPEVRGITDADDFRSWKQPFPMQLNRVTARDDEYWSGHRALPKAFVPLETAQRLWTSRFGHLTSLRVAIPDGLDTDAAREQFTAAVLRQLEPDATGLVFQPVRFNGLQAASGTTDFTGLFVGFSVFVIAAATILVGLLFRLGVERRVNQIGLLHAVGFTEWQVRRLILSEGLCVAGLGGLLGTAAAIGYARLMIAALKDPDWWGGALGTQFLNVSVRGSSLLAGLALSLTVAVLALLTALRGLNRVSPRQLLAGVTAVPLPDLEIDRFVARRNRLARGGAVVSLLIVAAGLAGLIPSSEAFSGLSWQVVAFFLVGVVLLSSALLGLSAWLAGDRVFAVRGGGLPGTVRLGMRNAARSRSRSLLSAALVAAATFVIVAVAAGRRNPAAETPDFHSGNGGFALVAESTAPLFDHPGTEPGRRRLGIGTQAAPGSDFERLLSEIDVFAFRVRPGENASCLNLYQTQLPTILGAPDELVRRGGFRFIDQRKADYWKLLTESRDDSLIPVLGDMNTLLFSLKKGPGATIDLPGSDRKLVVVGMFDSSVFQGVLLMSDSNFQSLFPEQPGFRYFLIGANQARADSGRGPLTRDELALLSSVFESALTAYGFDAEPVTDRIAAFLVVQNTYLSTFQTLGGLGLLLGTFGLATVMLRNVVERRGEFALLRAVGFRPGRLALLVLAENTLLLSWGLATGTACALLAMLPHLRSVGADTPWSHGAVLLAAVFAAGLLAALAAVRSAVRTPVLSTLRGE